MRYPISADRLELLTKLLVVAFELGRQENQEGAVRCEKRRSKRSIKAEVRSCGS